MKICPRCGTQCGDEMRFCMNCGSQLGAAAAADHAQEGTYRSYQQSDYEQEMKNSNYRQTRGAAVNRSIPLYVILSLVTCGIFMLYWMAVVNDDINEISGDAGATSGGMVVLFTILTCGIYGIYWHYKTGDKIDELRGTDKNTGLIYLVLSLLKLDIVNFCLIQDFLNSRAG